MDNSVYREIKREYDLKRQIAIDKSKKYKEEIYSKYPILEEIENEINMIALKTTKTILISDEITRQVEQENLALKLEKLNKKYDRELKKIGITRKDFEAKFECEKCKDTGVVLNNNNYSMCNCFSQAMINETYKQVNIYKLDEENFDTFDLGYYSKIPDKQKYGIEKSPMENIENIRRIAYNFSKNIDNPSQKNLLFVGNTGLGKTFLANCIASEVINAGKTVVYQTAPVLMDKVIEYKFSYNKTGIEKEQYDKIFNVDLLIIDDLGTETMSNNKFTELFNIINTRLLKNKKMLISTNLTLKELYKEYDERVMSRLIGSFTICKFIGEDIRLKKKKIYG